MQTIIVRDLIRKDLAVSPESGQILYNVLKSSIEEKNQTNVDFTGLATITTAFLNASIGNLYNHYDSDTLNQYITILGQTLTDLQRGKIRLVMTNAKNKLTNEQINEEM